MPTDLSPVWSVALPAQKSTRRLRTPAGWCTGTPQGHFRQHRRRRAHASLVLLVIGTWPGQLFEPRMHQIIQLTIRFRQRRPEPWAAWRQNGIGVLLHVPLLLLHFVFAEHLLFYLSDFDVWRNCLEGFADLARALFDRKTQDNLFSCSSNLNLPSSFRIDANMESPRSS